MFYNAYLLPKLVCLSQWSFQLKIIEKSVKRVVFLVRRLIAVNHGWLVSSFDTRKLVPDFHSNPWSMIATLSISGFIERCNRKPLWTRRSNLEKSLQNNHFLRKLQHLHARWAKNQIQSRPKETRTIYGFTQITDKSPHPRSFFFDSPRIRDWQTTNQSEDSSRGS